MISITALSTLASLYMTASYLQTINPEFNEDDPPTVILQADELEDLATRILIVTVPVCPSNGDFVFCRNPSDSNHEVTSADVTTLIGRATRLKEDQNLITLNQDHHPDYAAGVLILTVNEGSAWELYKFKYPRKAGVYRFREYTPYLAMSFAEYRTVADRSFGDGNAKKIAAAINHYFTNRKQSNHPQLEPPVPLKTP